jgi:hypothetical protein
MKFSNEQKREYVLQHAEPIASRPNFYLVYKDMKVFKKLRNNVIANLIIPVGTVMYMPEEKLLPIYGSYTLYKMRATAAYVHSIVNAKTKRTCTEGRSLSDWRFLYKEKSFVNAEWDCSQFLVDTMCVDGIHFFVTLKEALDY